MKDILFQAGQLFINGTPGNRRERADEAMCIEPSCEDVEVIHVPEQVGELRDPLILRDSEVMERPQPGLDCFPEVVELMFTVVGDDRAEVGTELLAEFPQTFFGAMGKGCLGDRAEGGAGVAEPDFGPGDRLRWWTSRGGSRVLFEQGSDRGDRGFFGMRTFGEGEPLPGGATGYGIARATEQTPDGSDRADGGLRQAEEIQPAADRLAEFPQGMGFLGNAAFRIEQAMQAVLHFIKRGSDLVAHGGGRSGGFVIHKVYCLPFFEPRVAGDGF